MSQTVINFSVAPKGLELTQEVVTWVESEVQIR